MIIIRMRKKPAPVILVPTQEESIQRIEEQLHLSTEQVSAAEAVNIKNGTI